MFWVLLIVALFVMGFIGSALIMASPFILLLCGLVMMLDKDSRGEAIGFVVLGLLAFGALCFFLFVMH